MVFESIRQELEDYEKELKDKTWREYKIKVIIDLVKDGSITMKEGCKVLEVSRKEMRDLVYSSIENYLYNLQPKSEEERQKIRREYFKMKANTKINAAEDIEYLGYFIKKNREDLYNFLLKNFDDGEVDEYFDILNGLYFYMRGLIKGFVQCRIGLYVDYVKENKVPIEECAECLNVSQPYAEMLVDHWDYFKEILENSDF